MGNVAKTCYFSILDSTESVAKWQAWTAIVIEATQHEGERERED